MYPNILTLSKTKNGIFIFALLTGVILTSCVNVISKKTIKEADRSITLEKVLKRTDSYKGKMVIWGGIIIKLKNLTGKTEIQVLQTESDTYGAPTNIDKSDGRFLAIYDGYLDGAIYRKGRELTIAGTVEGEKSIPIGEINYHYPVISVKEIYIWPIVPRAQQAYPRYNYGIFRGYYPYWGRYPWMYWR